MLDRLRFQEIEKVVFRAREKGRYGNRILEKGEPFLIIDNVAISGFKVQQREKTSIGKSVESSTSTIERVSFNLSIGQVMLSLFEDIFGTRLPDNESLFTVNGALAMEDSDTLELPSLPEKGLLLYLTDEYGKIRRISDDQFSVQEKIVTFIKPISHLITYVYEQKTEAVQRTSIKQIGAELILSLEMQCKGMDTLTEEIVPILMKFDRVSVGTNLDLSFNNSGKGSASTIYVEALTEDIKEGVNKSLFTIEVI